MSLSAVSKTAVLTLRARADEDRRSGRLFADPRAVEWSSKLTWPRELDRWYTPFAQAKTAIRAFQMDEIATMLLERSPDATVVELGCGFSTRAQRLGHEPWIVLDLPPVIAARRELGDTTVSIGASVLDTAWMDRVPSRDLLLLAEGLFFYLPRAEVDALFATLRARLPGTPLAFDVIGERDFKRSARASSEVGAPILWNVAPPFEASQEAMGLDVIPGLEPERVLAQTIEGFGVHFGPWFAAALRGVSGVPYMRARRSGIMVGRLRP